MFDTLVTDPIANLLVFLTALLAGSSGLALIAIGALVGIVTWPLRRVAAALEIEDLRGDYESRDLPEAARYQAKLKQSQQHLARRLLSTLAHLLFITAAVIAFLKLRDCFGPSQEATSELSSRLYDWSLLQEAIPISGVFLGIELESGSLLLAVLFAVIVYVNAAATREVVLADVLGEAIDERVATADRMSDLGAPVVTLVIGLLLPAALVLAAIGNLIALLVLAYAADGPLVNLRALRPVHGGEPSETRFLFPGQQKRLQKAVLAGRSTGSAGD
jgi:hypothetical protein